MSDDGFSDRDDTEAAFNRGYVAGRRGRWRPDMENAPRDMTPVDLFCTTDSGLKMRRTDCYWGLMRNWLGNEFHGWVGLGSPNVDWKPTHWMLTPAPPREVSDDQETAEAVRRHLSSFDGSADSIPEEQRISPQPPQEEE